jgi:plasmid stability protein
MKTTIDLPDDLVRRLKLRAVHERRKLKDVAAEFLRSGLDAPSSGHSPAAPAIVKDKKTGLPVIQCRRAAAPTPDQVAGLLAGQETEWADESA